jgi:hypothetical protein
MIIVLYKCFITVDVYIDSTLYKRRLVVIYCTHIDL